MSQGKNRYTLKLVLGPGWSAEGLSRGEVLGRQAEPPKAASQVARSLAGFL